MRGRPVGGLGRRRSILPASGFRGWPIGESPNCAASCRWCSRTRTPRSIRAIRPAAFSRARRGSSRRAAHAADVDRARRLARRRRAIAAASSRSAALLPFRRAQAARRDRARLRRLAGARALRRADIGARRLGAGDHPQPPRRSADEAACRLSLHLARPWRRALPRRPHRGHVSRADHRDRSPRRRSSARRITPTPRRFSRRCRRSTRARARDQALGHACRTRRIRPRAAGSIRAVPATSETSVANASRRGRRISSEAGRPIGIVATSRPPILGRRKGR